MDIHVDIPEGLLLVLNQVAKDQGVRRTHILREAITEYLNRVKAEQIEREMQAYVEVMAPYSAEFVAETNAHTNERLLRETTW